MCVSIVLTYNRWTNSPSNYRSQLRLFTVRCSDTAATNGSCMSYVSFFTGMSVSSPVRIPSPKNTENGKRATFTKNGGGTLSNYPCK